MARNYDDADPAEFYRVFWRSLEDEEGRFVEELNDEGAQVAFSPAAPELDPEWSEPWGSVDVDLELDDPFEFEVPARLSRQAGLRPPPPLEPVAGSAALFGDAVGLARASGNRLGAETRSGPARGVAHTARTSSVAPVTLQPAEQADHDDVIIARVGGRRRITAVHAAAMLSMAVVGGVAAHAALQPATSRSAAAAVQGASPAAAARTMVGASGEASTGDVSATAGFGSSAGVARVRDAIVARVEAATRGLPEGQAVHTVAPVVISAAPRQGPVQQAGPARSDGAALAPSDIDRVAAKRAEHSLAGAASDAAPRGGLAPPGQVDHRAYSEVPPGATAVDWRKPERAAGPSTEAQMKATRLRFNRSRFDASWVKREPARK